MTIIYIKNIKNLEQDEIFQNEFIKMNDQRKENILKFNADAEKIRSLAAGILMETGFRDFTHQLTETINLKLKYGHYGKPYFIHYPEVFFSISHSGEYVVAAFSNQEIGIDLQQRKKISENIPQRIFTEKEMKKFLLQKDKNQQLFFDFWTAKESYIKLTGEGMFRPLNSFSVDFHEQGIFDQEGRNKIANIKKIEYEMSKLPSDYSLTIAGKFKILNAGLKIKRMI